MTRTTTSIRASGAWLAVAALLMIAVFLLHGPIAPDLRDQMHRIAEGATRWSVVHWMAAVALSLYALSGLLVLSSGSRLSEGGLAMTAWAAVPVTALWTATTAVAEATVVAHAAASGATQTFLAWWAFSEGKAHGIAFFALAIAAIAANEVRSPRRATPRWAAGLAVLAALASFAGWALGMWLGLAAGNLLWLAASLLMSAWILWFGLSLMNNKGAVDEKATNR